MKGQADLFARSREEKNDCVLPEQWKKAKLAEQKQKMKMKTKMVEQGERNPVGRRRCKSSPQSWEYS